MRAGARSAPHPGPLPAKQGEGVLVSLGLLLCACGPGGGLFTVLDEGTGEPVVTHINRAVGSSYVFGLMDATGKVSSTSNAAYTGHTTLTGGPEVLVYSTPDGDVFLEHSADGNQEFVWGSNGDLATAPQLAIRLPLRLGTRWRTNDEKGTAFYEFRVETVERVTVPAGTFDTAKLVQLNLRQGTQVDRWYAQDVGLVQRNQSLLFSYSLAQETP